MHRRPCSRSRVAALGSPLDNGLPCTVLPHDWLSCCGSAHGAQAAQPSDWEVAEPLVP